MKSYPFHTDSSQNIPIRYSILKLNPKQASELYFTRSDLASRALPSSLHCRFKLIACPPSTAAMAMRWRWAYQVKCRAKNHHLLCRYSCLPYQCSFAPAAPTQRMINHFLSSIPFRYVKSQDGEPK